MENHNSRWKVQDKRRLLLVLLNELAGNAHVSFEGDLSGLKILSLQGASAEPTSALKRNTLRPKQHFVVVPPEPANAEQILSAIGGTIPWKILHIQIEKDGQLQFGAYDNFHPDCIYFGKAVKQPVLDSLFSGGIMRPYTERRPLRKVTSS